jgi:hypothetical protein
MDRISQCILRRCSELGFQWDRQPLAAYLQTRLTFTTYNKVTRTAAAPHGSHILCGAFAKPLFIFGYSKDKALMRIHAYLHPATPMLHACQVCLRTHKNVIAGDCQRRIERESSAARRFQALLKLREAPGSQF